MKTFLKIFLALWFAGTFLSGCAEYKLKTYDVKCPKCNTTFTIEEEIHMRSLGFGSP